MARWILAPLLLLSPMIATASDKWGATDSVLLGANMVAYALDAQMTMRAQRVRNNAGEYVYAEQNALLGEHPDDGRIRDYFTASALLHAGISYALPHKYSRAFQVAALSVSLYAIADNYRIGIRFGF